MKSLPILEEKAWYHPRQALCPWCRERKVLEPHSMAILSGGALARRDEDTYAGPTEGLRGYLSFDWHGAHDSGEGDYPGGGVSVQVAREVDGGVFYVMFCSVACLRAFLNDCMDKLEKKIQTMKRWEAAKDLRTKGKRITEAVRRRRKRGGGKGK